jgi:hypothetical protein
MTRRVAVILWLLLGLLGLGAGAACFASVPVSASGLAIVTKSPASPGDVAPVALLMPQETLRHLETGQEAELFLGAGESAVPGSILTIESEPLNAAAIEQRLGLPASALSLYEGPVVLVWVSVDSTINDILDQGVGRAELPAGSRQAGSFLPLIGRLFRGDA